VFSTGISHSKGRKKRKKKFERGIRQCLFFPLPFFFSLSLFFPLKGEPTLQGTINRCHRKPFKRRRRKRKAESKLPHPIFFFLYLVSDENDRLTCGLVFFFSSEKYRYAAAFYSDDFGKSIQPTSSLHRKTFASLSLFYPKKTNLFPPF